MKDVLEIFRRDQSKPHRHFQPKLDSESMQPALQQGACNKSKAARS